MKDHILPGMLKSVSKSTVIAVLIALCAVLILVVVGAARSRAMLSAKRLAADIPTQESGVTVRRTERVQVVRFTLYDVGIVPQTAYAQPGLVTIAVEDLSGGTTGLVVERDDEGQARTQLGEVRRNENKRRCQAELRLAPGRYQLYMADRPENRAELIVEP